MMRESNRPLPRKNLHLKSSALLGLILGDENFDEDEAETFFFTWLLLFVIDIYNVKPVRKNKWKTNGYTMTSDKSVGLVYDKKWTFMEW